LCSDHKSDPTWLTWARWSTYSVNYSDKP
jgi:hypothetical protein